MTLSTRIDRRWFAAVFACLVGLHLALVWTTRLFPFTDLPNHLAAATIMRHYSDPACLFSDYFEIELFPRPNVFHLLFCSQKIFPSVEFANRVFLSLYVLLLPLSTLFFLGRTGGNRWWALTSFVLLYNYSASWGFVGFFFSIPIVLIFAGLIEGYYKRGGAGRAMLLALLLASLFFVHALGALFALLLLLVCGLFRAREGPLVLLSRLAPALPVVVLLIVWWRSEPPGGSLADFLARYYSSSYLSSITSRANFLILDNYHLFPRWPGALVALALVAAFITPGAILLVRAHRRSDRSRLAPSVPFLFFACSLACFLLLPHEIPRQTILYQRFSVLLLLSFVFLAASVAPSGALRTARILFVAAAAVHLVLWAGYLSAFDAENEGFDASFFPADKGNGRLAGLIMENAFRNRAVYLHFPSYYTVWKRGISTTSIVAYRFGPVRRNPDGPTLPHYLEWIGKTDGSGGRYEEMEYLLVRGSLPDRAMRHISGRALLREISMWRLYGRRSAD